MANKWIGFDFDKTLATHTTGDPSDKLGEPIPLVVDILKAYLAKGKEVKIFTARASGEDGPEFRAEQVRLLEEWSLKHIGQVLPITASKDSHMDLLYDDRAVAIRPNNGESYSFRPLD